MREETGRLIRKSTSDGTRNRHLSAIGQNITEFNSLIGEVNLQYGVLMGRILTATGICCANLLKILAGGQ